MNYLFDMLLDADDEYGQGEMHAQIQATSRQEHHPHGHSFRFIVRPAPSSALKITPPPPADDTYATTKQQLINKNSSSQLQFI